jgi:hypothetical protein
MLSATTTAPKRLEIFSRVRMAGIGVATPLHLVSYQAPTPYHPPRNKTRMAGTSPALTACGNA